MVSGTILITNPWLLDQWTPTMGESVQTLIQQDRSIITVELLLNIVINIVLVESYY